MGFSATMRQPELAPDLDLRAVREIVSSQFPMLALSQIELLGGGGGYQVFLVDGQWAFRFPRDRDGEFPLLHEVGFLPDVAPALPFSVPCYQLLGMPDDRFPFRFAAYRLLPGVPAWQAGLSESALKAMAAQLGRALGVLHTYSPARAREFGLWCDIELRAPARTRLSALRDLEDARAWIGERLYSRCRAFLGDESAVPPAYTGAACVVHGDLQPGHVLIEPDSGRVTGVIDWSGLQLADPAMDFAALWAWQGDDLAAAMLAAYDVPQDPGLWDRMRYRGTCLAIEWIQFSIAHPGPATELYLQAGLASLRRSFSARRPGRRHR